METQIFDLKKRRVDKLQLILLSGHTVPLEYRAHYDSAYRLWQSVWTQTFQELKSQAAVQADDFVRQDIVSGLFDGQESVGLVLYTYHDLELSAVRDHSYLHTYPRAIVSELRKSGRSNLLSMEYLTLNPMWRSAFTGVSLAKVLLGIAPKILECSGVETIITVPRKDIGIQKILYEYGARCLVKDLDKHNVKVDLASFERGRTKSSGNAEVDRLVEKYWSQRIDTVGLSRTASTLTGRKSA